MQASWSKWGTFLPQHHSPQFRLRLPASELIIITFLIQLCCKSTWAAGFQAFWKCDLKEALCLGPINLCFPAAKCQQRNSVHVAVQHSVCASSSGGCRRIFVCRRGVPLSYTRQQLVDFLKRHANGSVCQFVSLPILLLDFLPVRKFDSDFDFVFLPEKRRRAQSEGEQLVQFRCWTRPLVTTLHHIAPIHTADFKNLDCHLPLSQTESFNAFCCCLHIVLQGNISPCRSILSFWVLNSQNCKFQQSLNPSFTLTTMATSQIVYCVHIVAAKLVSIQSIK